jgi:hypothetical protein
MRSPSKLRYVECELPSEVEKAIAAFEDEFDDNIKPFYDRLADFEANDLPAIQKEIDAQIALREELVKGSPVQNLASLDAIDNSTGLTSPKRDNDDPETVRIDERKMGAAGICLLNGRMFKMEGGNRLVALRRLWEAAGGDYDYFVRLGTTVYTSPRGSYNLFEFNTYTPEKLPFVNKGFSYLEAVNLKNSQFKHRLIWTNSISASYALKTKMVALGFFSEQINNLFSGSEPNAGYDYLGAIADINILISSVTRLLFLPASDPIRQPPWENEANYVELAIQKFLDYRTHKYTSSEIFDLNYWTLFLDELRPRDIKELLEQRPEVLDIELPQDQASITAAVEKAVAFPPETSIINTYMNNLPASTDDELQLTNSLYNLGYGIYLQLEARQETRAGRLKELLLELIGKSTLVSYIGSNVLIDPADLAALFPNANLPPVGQFVSVIETRDPLVKTALAANSGVAKFNKTESKTIQDQSLTLSQGSATNNMPAGKSQGFPSVETFAMLLARRVDWGTNFTDCKGEQALGVASTPVEQEMATVVSNERTLSVDVDNDKWNRERVFKDNMAYLNTQLGAYLVGSSIKSIQSGVDAYIQNLPNSIRPSPQDTEINELKERMYSNEIRMVAAAAVDVLKALPSSSVLTPAKTNLFSEMSGDDRGAGMYAAKNRNYVEDAGGKVPPAGFSQTEVKDGLEKALGTTLPFLDKGTNVVLPTHSSTNVELQICSSKSLKKLAAFARQYESNRKQLEAWLVKFINIVKHQIIVFQDRIDKFIVTVQQTMDAVMAKLERLLTLDLNFSGKIGFENSLFKCSWGLDLGLKINLLDLLLLYLDRFLGTIMGPILKGLGIIGDFINQILCIPIRWLGEILNSAAKAMSDLLGKVGCSVKDFKLPTAVFELLNLINGTFSLRSLVLRKGTADWLRMMNRIKLGRNEFQGLSQFASVCAKPSLSAAISTLQFASQVAASDIPVKATYRGVDAPAQALGVTA